MRPGLGLLFLTALFWIPAPGHLAGQEIGADLGPVRADRFRAHAAPAPWMGRAALGADTAHTDTIPADSSGSFLVSAGVGAVGAVAGFYVGFSLPYGILYMPVVGAAYGAQLGDRWSGGADPSLAGALLGAVLGGVAGVVPCTAGFCQGPPFTIIPGLAIGAALGVSAVHYRRTLSKARPVAAPPPPPQPPLPDPGAR